MSKFNLHQFHKSDDNCKVTVTLPKVTHANLTYLAKMAGLKASMLARKMIEHCIADMADELPPTEAQ